MIKRFVAKNARVVGGTLEAGPWHSAIEIEAEEITDTYHTFSELYQHRMALHVALVNAFRQSDSPNSPNMCKSKLHSDGTMFDGYFIVVFHFGGTFQISYHYKLEHWDLFDCKEVEKAPAYDGHTSQDVIQRLLEL